jgi:hypothetical protein
MSKFPRGTPSISSLFSDRDQSDYFSYVQFAPVAYIVKLYIELTMAVLISKVVHSSSTERVDDMFSSGNVTSNRTVTNRRTNPWPDMQRPDIQILSFPA